ncbi:MAG: hypothetical protein QOD31_466 [Pseudonocardiales bacterium]|nr:hypothetical protein [Pseudonocardiales bacterium]
MSELLPIDEQPTMVTGPMDFYTPDPPEDGLAPVPVPVPVAAAQPPAATETITCPECGTIATVTLNRRDSSDFCRNCDYPLVWTPSRLLRDRSLDTGDQALRRLPGTVGRATLASLVCPHCAEPNAVSAVTCVRCLQPMVVVQVLPPAPEPVVYVPPPVYVEPEPEPGVAWWVWALIGAALVATVVLVILIVTHTVG